MTESEALVASIWHRLTFDWSKLTTYRNTSLRGETAARQALLVSNAQFAQELLHGKHKHLLTDQVPLLAIQDQMPELVTDATIQEYRRFLYGSTLVFAHAILEAAILDCLRLTASEVPDLWRLFVARKKVSIADAITMSSSAILQGVIADELTRLERASILDKVDRCFEVVRPERSNFLTDGFRFDRKRLQALDELRHRIVHEPGGTWEYGQMEAELAFLRSSGVHILVMTLERLNLQLNPDDSKEMFLRRSPSRS